VGQRHPNTFAAYPLFTQVLLLTGRAKLFPVKLGKPFGHGGSGSRE
jgi:hypothetical protein